MLNASLGSGRKFTAFDAASFIVSAVSLTVFCGGCRGAGRLTELQRVQYGTLDVVVLSAHDALRHGKDTFVIEFRRTSGGALVDVGTVHGSVTMPMPGMPMLGSIDVTRTNVPGRYEATGDFSMAGTWRMMLRWNGPAGEGSVTLTGNVQ